MQTTKNEDYSIYNKVSKSINRLTNVPLDRIKINFYDDEKASNWQDPIHVSVTMPDGKNNAEAICDIGENQDFDSQILYIIEQLEDCFEEDLI